MHAYIVKIEKTFAKFASTRAVKLQDLAHVSNIIFKKNTQEFSRGVLGERGGFSHRFLGFFSGHWP